MMAQEDVTELYRSALDSFVDKVKKDRMVLAAILAGSLSYDQVWEKSDIDIVLVARDDIKQTRSYSLTENDINIHAVLMPRGKFKAEVEGALRSSFFHSYFSKSTLLFTTDESIRELYGDAQRLGARDRETMMLREANALLPCLTKAEKWFHVKRDYRYSAVWLLWCVRNLASIEIVSHGEITGRETLQQALRLNPELFTDIYLKFIDEPKDETSVARVLKRINDYLDERIHVLFRPILDYLREFGEVCPTSHLDEHFKRAAHGSLEASYEWLADKGLLQKVPHPTRLTEKSSAAVDEAAYFYDDEETE